MSVVRRLALRVTALRLHLDRITRTVGVVGRVADILGVTLLVHALDILLLALVVTLFLLDALLRLLAKLTVTVKVLLLPRLVDLFQAIQKTLFLMLFVLVNKLPNDIWYSECSAQIGFGLIY
jgi:hypothetical protein